MESYVTFTELKQNLRAVKEAACEDVVHVLHNGKPGYVLCSFEVWERRMGAARRRGAYRANVEESIRESEWDERDNRLVEAGDVVCMEYDGGARSRICEAALHYLDLEYNDEQRALLGHTLSELAERPTIGMVVDVEYGGQDAPVRKFLSPPCDVLYTASEKQGLIVRGFVRSLDWEAPQEA